MKLFQIEEPEGGPVDRDGPGAAVGIDLDWLSGGAVAVAVGGNAEILPGPDGAKRLPALGVRDRQGGIDGDALGALLLQLRSRAEKQLARPVTHAVIAVEALDPASRVLIAKAALASGLEPLLLAEWRDLVGSARDADPADAAALGAALRAEDLAPPAL